MSSYIRAIAVLIGTIFGVGVFTIPYVVQSSGVIPFFVLLVIISVSQYYLHLIYAEVVLSTNHYHHLPGYVGKYFHSKKAQNLVLLIAMVGNFASLLAYILIGGIFLNQLLAPVMGDHLFFYTSLLFVVQAIIVFLGNHVISRLELGMTIGIVALIFIVIWKGSLHMDATQINYATWSNFLLPYGLIFSAMNGVVAIPYVCKILSEQKKRVKGAIAWGVGISAVITGLFVFVAYGVSGANTTPDTLAGLSGIFHPTFFSLILVLGILAIVTSFLVFAESMKEIFVWDFKVNKHLAWALACFIPYGLYLMGVNNLTRVVNFAGSIAGTALGTIMILVYLRARKNPEQYSSLQSRVSVLGAILLIGLFLAGFINEFI